MVSVPGTAETLESDAHVDREAMLCSRTLFVSGLREALLLREHKRCQQHKKEGCKSWLNWGSELLCRNTTLARRFEN